MGQTLQNIIDALLNIFFETSDYLWVIPACLFLAGIWRILEKSGLKGWWALVPCARDYQLARCAGKEPEGRTVAVVLFFRMVLNTLIFLAPLKEYTLLLLAVIVITLSIVIFFYRVSICSGLIEVYGTKKSWIWLWIFSTFRWIPAIVWGWNKAYSPEWKVEDLQKEMTRRASFGSVDVMENGLTVNIKERSTIDFFRKKLLLWDIHMYIPQGHMVLLLGGSGAGKTTFVNAVNGYEKAKAEVVLNGTDIYKHYNKMQYEAGFVPQQDLMRYKDTVYHTLMDTAKLRLPVEIPAETRKDRVEHVMEVFGLTPLKTSLVEKLSGGQKKRLSIAMELISNPSLFILDEPDSGLDGVMARELMEQLRRVADTGKIVIVITHTPDRVIEFFDDVIVLAKDAGLTGRLAFYGSIREAREFFGCEKMEDIVKLINQKAEGGSGRSDEFIEKYMEVRNA